MWEEVLKWILCFFWEVYKVKLSKFYKNIIFNLKKIIIIIINIIGKGTVKKVKMSIIKNQLWVKRILLGFTQ